MSHITPGTLIPTGLVSHLSNVWTGRSEFQVLRMARVPATDGYQIAKRKARITKRTHEGPLKGLDDERQESEDFREKLVERWRGGVFSYTDARSQV